MIISLHMWLAVGLWILFSSFFFLLNNHFMNQIHDNNPINQSWKHGIWPIEIRKCFKKLNYEHTHIMIISYTICYQHLGYGTILFSFSFSLVRQSFYEPQLWINPKTFTENIGFNPKSKKEEEKSFNKLQHLCILFAQLLLTNVWPTLGNSVNISWGGGGGGGGGGGEDEEVYIKCSHNSSWIARDEL